MKRIMIVALVAVSSLFAQPGETWNVGESVYRVSSIDLEPNVDAQYLNQIKRTWVNSMEVAKAEGLVEDYQILRSINNYDGDFDLLLIIKYKNLATLDSNPKNNKKWDEVQEKARKITSQEQQQQITSTFPKMRTVRDEKLMREITFIKQLLIELGPINSTIKKQKTPHERGFQLTDIS